MRQEQRLDHEQVSQVFDSGRRGKPLPGCDCEQCFGYCYGFVDQDTLVRTLNIWRERRIPDIDGPVDMLLNRPSYDEG